LCRLPEKVRGQRPKEAGGALWAGVASENGGVKPIAENVARTRTRSVEMNSAYRRCSFGVLKAKSSGRTRPGRQAPQNGKRPAECVLRVVVG
jgi:hypothetical protein